MNDAAIRVGRRVRLPWGFDTVEGTIIDVFGSPARPFVRVEVELPGLEDAADAPVIALPAESVDAASTPSL